ncbi:MAG: DNA polymerase III subunit beta, partial [Nitrospinota bacterium]
MEITITREDFLKGLHRIQSIVERRNTTPILTHFLLEATAEEVRISATDLELGFRGTLAAETITPGSLALAARQTYDIVRELSSETPITLTALENNWVQLTADRAVFKIPSLRGDDFPPLPSSEEKDGIEINDQTFREMIGKTIFSISQDETRFALKGALFALHDDEMRMVSSDGHRLAYIRRPHAGIPTPQEVIVPKKALEEIRKLLEESKGEEETSFLGVAGSHLIFKKDDVLLTSRLIEGQFPPYEQVIPRGYEKRALLNREMLLGALKRVSLLSNEK